MSDPVELAILRNFSSSNNKSKWEFYEDVGNSRKEIDTIQRYYAPLFYANGNCKENEGYVSITFEQRIERYDSELDMEVCCHVSVMDVAGNKRFTQSIVFVYRDINHPERFVFGLERYLKRETLLNDPDELLPGDCLTVCMEFEFNTLAIDCVFDEHLHRIKDTICEDENKRDIWIFLDTDFGRDLCRVSEYFRCAAHSPFIENSIRKVRIEKEEEKMFVGIFFIFYGTEKIYITIADIWDLYRVADKYDIQLVIETCRQFVKALLRTTGNSKCRKYVDDCVQEIMKLADHYRDNDMKDAVETYLKSIENFGTDDYAIGLHLKEKLYTEWKCKFEEVFNFESPMITLRRRFVEPEFKFYQ